MRSSASRRRIFFPSPWCSFTFAYLHPSLAVLQLTSLPYWHQGTVILPSQTRVDPVGPNAPILAASTASVKQLARDSTEEDVGLPEPRFTSTEVQLGP